MISFNFLMCLLGWVESPLICSLSLLCTDTAALPPHGCQRRTVFSHGRLLSNLPRSLAQNWLIICTYVQGQPPWSFHFAWDSAPSFFPVYSDTISILVKSLSLLSHHLTTHVFLTPRLESDTDHTCACGHGYGTTHILLVEYFCIFCSLHLSANSCFSTANSLLSIAFHMHHTTHPVFHSALVSF